MQLLLTAYLLDAILAAVRSFAMARLLPTSEFGLALVLIALFSLVEMVSDLGINQQAIRVPEADVEARATLQTLNLVRSLCLGFGMLVATPFLLQLYDQPNAWPAFICIAASFPARALFNLSLRQQSRVFNFFPEAITQISSQIAWTVTAIAVCFVLGTHNGAAAGIIVSCVTTSVVSNLVSKSPLRFGWRKDVALEARRFSLPLLPNGIMIAFTALADRLFLGSLLGLEALAIYGPLITLLMLPRGVTIRFLTSVAQPHFIDQPPVPHAVPLIDRWAALLCLTGAAFCLGFMSMGDVAIRLAFGVRYEPPQLLVTLCAFLGFARIVSQLPVPQAIATGNTGFLTQTSAIQAISMLLALITIWVHPSLATFLAVLSALEIAGVMVTAWRTGHRFAEQTTRLYLTIGTGLLPCLILALAIHWFGLTDLLGRILLAFVLGMGAIAALRSGFSILRSKVG